MSEGPFSRDAGHIILCEVISKKVPYCGTNSAILDQLYSHFCDYFIEGELIKRLSITCNGWVNQKNCLQFDLTCSNDMDIR